jgi:hypothetical protein
MDAPDPDFADEESSGDAKLGFVPELVRKVAVAGLGALFMTEEGIRSLAGQLKVPKEVLGFIVSQADRTKDELGRMLSDEVRRFLQSDRFREEFLKLLAGMAVEIKAEVRLVPDGQRSDAPRVKITHLRTSRKKRGKG